MDPTVIEPSNEPDIAAELASATIEHLTGDVDSRLAVLANQHYRFLVLNGTIQSVMDLQAPDTLVFPHQKIMLSGLATLAPDARVLELGLGGGSAIRHAAYHYPDFQWTSVESNSDVVNLYFDYFQAEQPLVYERISIGDAMSWLRETDVSKKFELVLCDVYAELQETLLLACLERLTDDGELLINWIPHMQPQGKNSQQLLNMLVSSQQLEHQVDLVPGYRNQIHRLKRKRRERS